MQKERWAQIETILDTALALSGKERIAYIAEVCKNDSDLLDEVYALLEAAEESKKTHFLEGASKENEQLLQDLSKPSPCGHSSVGTKIGNFTLIELIGKGGMGNVYRAERSDGQFDQHVAVKLLREGIQSEEILQRFRMEQEILAGLKHPHIAQLYDGGITEKGLSYLVMEYVDGMPIDEYSNEQKLTIDERITLFTDVCSAVQFAHSNLVVHRDLKAQNIYVTTEGIVKILDFGIAKLLDAKLTKKNLLETRPNQKFWTPQYAAPEQVLGMAVTTAADVYALGVLLHKLLTDTYPLDLENKKIVEIEQVIRTAIPIPPSQAVSKDKKALKTLENRQVTHSELNKLLTGDLDAIVMKAIRKESENRYSSIGQLLEDIDRYRTGVPLLARTDTLQYRTKKFVSRHKTALAFTTTILVLLAIFLGIYTFQITKERNQAQAEANKAEMVTSFLIGLFEASDPTEAQGDTISAKLLLERGLERAEALNNQPGVQSQMLETIGRVYRRLGQYEQSHILLERALENRQQNYGMKHIETASSLDHLGMLLSDEGAYQSAESLLRQALQIRIQQQGLSHPAVAETQSHLAYALRKLGQYKEAEQLYRSSLQIHRKHFGNSHPLTVASLSSLGTTLHNRGDYKATEELYREVLKQRQELLVAGHPDIAMSYNNLGALLMNLGQLEESEHLLRKALDLRQKVYGSPHPKVALTMNNLGLILKDMGNITAAESLFTEALKMRTELLGNQHMETGITLFALGELMLSTNRPDSALSLFEEALTIFTQKLPDDHSLTARTAMSVGSAYGAIGNTSKAEQFLTAGFEKIQRIHPDSTLERALAEQQLGIFYFDQKNFTRAQTLLTKAYNTLKYIEGKDSYRQKHILTHLDRMNERNSNGN